MLCSGGSNRVDNYEFKGYILHPRKGTSYGRINVERVIKGNGKVSQNINFKRGLSVAFI